jgi:hypothetical protein
MFVVSHVDERDAKMRVDVAGERRGAIARGSLDGRRRVDFDATHVTLVCDHLAGSRTQGLTRFIAAIVAGVRPDKRYRVFDGDEEIAQVANVLRWRDGHIALTLTDGRCWRVYGSGLLPTTLRVERDGVACGEMQIRGVLRAQLYTPDFGLPPLVAIAFAAVVLELWGNDPFAGGSE